MATMQLVSMLGLRTNLTGAITYVDETDVQYVCGNALVRFDTETRVQRIVPGSPQSVGITAVAVASHKR
jgi:hypothetical protein